VSGQVLVEFLCNLVDLPESGPRNSREIVVLVVQTNVVGQVVEGSVVRESLGNQNTLFRVARLLVLKRRTVENVVFGDEVASHGVQRSGQETAQNEVSNSLAAPRLDKDVIEQQLNNNVECVDLGHGDLVDHHRSESVEQNLECAEEGLAGDGVEEKCFESGRQVGIKAIDAERFVMGQVVGLWRSQWDGQIPKYLRRRTLKEAE
jgi:hypothetical protein